MKKKNLNAKLSLKKITISKLEAGEMQHFVGGGSDGCPTSDNLCNSYAKCLPEVTRRGCPQVPAPDPQTTLGPCTNFTQVGC